MSLVLQRTRLCDPESPVTQSTPLCRGTYRWSTLCHSSCTDAGLCHQHRNQRAPVPQTLRYPTPCVADPAASSSDVMEPAIDTTGCLHMAVDMAPLSWALQVLPICLVTVLQPLLCPVTVLQPLLCPVSHFLLQSIATQDSGDFSWNTTGYFLRHTSASRVSCYPQSFCSPPSQPPDLMQVKWVAKGAWVLSSSLVWRPKGAIT